MPLRFHIVHESDPRLLQRLDAIHVVLEHLANRTGAIHTTQGDIMATIKELVASVAAVKGKVDSVGTLITQLREQITGLTNGNLPPDVQAQVDQAFADAEASKTELSAAIDNPGGPVTPPNPAPTPAIGGQKPDAA